MARSLLTRQKRNLATQGDAIGSRQARRYAAASHEDLNEELEGAAARRIDQEPSAFPDRCRSMGLGIWESLGDRDGHCAGEMPPLRRLAHGCEFFEKFGTATNTVQMRAVPPSGGRSVAAGGKRRAPLRKSCILRRAQRDTMKIRSHSESHLVELDDGSRWQIFPGDLNLTLNWQPDTVLAVVPHRRRGEFSCADRRGCEGARDTRQRKLAGTAGEVRAQGGLMPFRS